MTDSILFVLLAGIAGFLVFLLMLFVFSLGRDKGRIEGVEIYERDQLIMVRLRGKVVQRYTIAQWRAYNGTMGNPEQPEITINLDEPWRD